MSSVTGQAQGIAAFQSSCRSAAVKTATTPSAFRASSSGDARDASARVRAPHDDHRERPGGRHVVDERALAGEERAILAPLDRRADVRRPLLGRAHDALPMRSRPPDGHDDVVVAGAAAEVPFEPFADRLLARRVAVLDQRDRRHHHPRRAVAALERVVVVERLLHGMQLAVRREALDRRDLRAVRLNAEHRARLRRGAVDEDRARAARGRVAADVRARSARARSRST